MGEKHSTASVQALPPSGAIELLASLPKSHIPGEEQESDIKQDRPCHERVFWLFEPSPSIMPCKQRKSTAFLWGDCWFLDAVWRCWKILANSIPTCIHWAGAECQSCLPSSSKLWTKVCQGHLLLLPGTVFFSGKCPILIACHFSGNCHYFDRQSAKYDGLGGLMCPLLHHAVALLLRPLLHRQLQGCEAQLPQLQCYPWTL